MTEEAKLILSHAITLPDGRLEFPSATFVMATKMTKARLAETFPPD